MGVSAAMLEMIMMRPWPRDFMMGAAHCTRSMTPPHSKYCNLADSLWLRVPTDPALVIPALAMMRSGTDVSFISC